MRDGDREWQCSASAGAGQVRSLSPHLMRIILISIQIQKPSEQALIVSILTRCDPEWTTAVVRDHDIVTPALLGLAGSLCHKGAYNRTFPCMEATYPFCHKEPARSKQMGVFCVGCDELVLYGIRELA